MSLERRSKPKPERRDRLSVFKTHTNRVLPLLNDSDERVDINQIRISFEPEPKRQITLKSVGNFLRHSRGSQIHNKATSSRHNGGKKIKNTKKHKSRKNRTKRKKHN